MRKNIPIVLLSMALSLTSTGQTPGNALAFDGLDDYVSTALPTVFNDLTNNDFTIETWVMPQGSSTQRIFFAQHDPDHFVSVLLNTSNTPYIYLYNGLSQGYNLSGPLTVFQWAHLAVTWEAPSQQLKVYVDGVLQNLSPGGTSTTGFNNVLTLGSRSDGIQNLAGQLDEFRIWNYARSACEITTGMNSEFTEPQPGLVVYYNFNEGTAGGNNSGLNNLPDFTGSANGTLYNFTLAGSYSNWVSSGALINSVNQNGNVNTSVTQNGITLTANATGAAYQWLDCNDEYAVIPGQTGQTFIASTDGSYAVEVSQNGCVDTSECIVINTVGLPGIPAGTAPSLYPVPAGERVTVDLGREYRQVQLNLIDNTGKKLYERAFGPGARFVLDLPRQEGLYFIEIRTDEGKAGTLKVVRQ